MIKGPLTLTLASRITVLRILAVPFFITALLYYTPEREYLRFTALGLFLFAVISDVIDGYIARRYHQRSYSGAILDPLADKLLLMSAFICLYMAGVYLPIRFPLWLVVAVISRDVILLAGATVLNMVQGQVPIAVTKWGKASTFVQVLTVLAMFFQCPYSYVLWGVTAVLVVVSGLDYIAYGIRILNMPKNVVPINKE